MLQGQITGPGAVINIDFQIIMNIGFLFSVSLFHQYCTAKHN